MGAAHLARYRIHTHLFLLVLSPVIKITATMIKHHLTSLQEALKIHKVMVRDSPEEDLQLYFSLVAGAFRECQGEGGVTYHCVQVGVILPCPITIT